MNETVKPLVSIIIPVYNGANYMREAIDSALGQSYENIEILVINDGSADEGATEKIALNYGDKIRYFRKENGGVSSALNLGIRNMKGEYFSWLSHDDVYLPTKVEKQVEALGNYRGQDVAVYCKTMMIDENSREISYRRNRISLPPLELLSSERVLHHILCRNTLGGCNMLIPRNLFERFGMFNESLRYSQDSLMWYTLFSHGVKLYKTDEFGVKSRIHSAQLTQTGKAIFKKDSEAMCDIILPYFDAIATEKDDFVYEYALHEAKYGLLPVVQKCVEVLKRRGRYSLRKRIKLGLYLKYAQLRPMLRNIYYKLKNIRVQK